MHTPALSSAAHPTRLESACSSQQHLRLVRRFKAFTKAPTRLKLVLRHALRRGGRRPRSGLPAGQRGGLGAGHQRRRVGAIVQRRLGRRRRQPRPSRRAAPECFRLLRNHLIKPCHRVNHLDRWGRAPRSHNDLLVMRVYWVVCKAGCHSCHRVVIERYVGSVSDTPRLWHVLVLPDVLHMARSEGTRRVLGTEREVRLWMRTVQDRQKTRCQS